MNGLNALNMRQEPKRGAKLAEKLKCEKSSIHYLSILNGNTRGLVWTDDPTAPRLAVVYSYLLGGFQIMGTPLQTAEEYAAFRLFFENKVFPLAKDEFELSEFAYSADTEALSDMMRVVFFRQRAVRTETACLSHGRRIQRGGNAVRSCGGGAADAHSACLGKLPARKCRVCRGLSSRNFGKLQKLRGFFETWFCLFCA